MSTVTDGSAASENKGTAKFQTKKKFQLLLSTDYFLFLFGPFKLFLFACFFSP